MTTLHDVNFIFLAKKSAFDFKLTIAFKKFKGPLKVSAEIRCAKSSAVYEVKTGHTILIV